MDTEKLPERVGLLVSVVAPYAWRGHWLTIDEMTELTHLHPSVVRWCIKQLSTGEEGKWIVRRRKRKSVMAPQEFYIRPKPSQMRFPFSDVA